MGRCGRSGVGEAIAAGAGFDDLALVGEPVDDAGAEPAQSRRGGEAAAIVTKVTVGQYVKLQVWTNRDHDFAC